MCSSAETCCTQSISTSGSRTHYFPLSPVADRRTLLVGVRQHILWHDSVGIVHHVLILSSDVALVRE